MTVTTGTVVIAEAVVAPNGALYPTDAEWRAAPSVALAAGGIEFALSRVAGCDTPTADADAKQRLFDRTGASCCDMESHMVGQVAAKAHVPFAAVRVVADEADRILPAAALSSVGPDGGLRIGRFIGAVVRRPSNLADLVMLAVASRKALGVLRHLVSVRNSLLAVP